VRLALPRLITVCLFALTVLANSCATAGDSGVSTTVEQTATAPLATAPITTSPIETQTQDALYQNYASAVYSDPKVWLCLPDVDDVCEGERTTTVIYPDGRTEVIAAQANSDALVDCFYVYPTASHDMAPNSDLIPDPEGELATTWNQVSRYSEICDVYAPMYRQRPMPAISGLVEIPEDDLIGGPGTTGFEIAYADVFDAFRHYISNAAEGRGFILIGHSQGTAMLTELLRREIDQSPLLRDRFVSAHLFGGAHIAAGGNEFEKISGCADATEVGCIIAYNTFHDDAPPVADSWFGRTWHHPSWSITSWEDLSWEKVVSAPSLCVNPKTFASGKAEFTPYFPVTEEIEKAFDVDTSWVTYPGLLFGQCVNDGTFGYLSVEIHANLTDPRATHISSRFDSQSGLHDVDMNIALGDLIAAAKTQSANYSSSVSLHTNSKH